MYRRIAYRRIAYRRLAYGRIAYRRLAAVITLALLVVTVPATAASAASVNVTYPVWAWNVAGQALHGGSTTDGLIRVLADSIRNRGAQFAALNELCWRQFKAVQANLLGSDWPEDAENFSRFEAQSDTACDGEPYGVAIFSKAPLGPANRYALAVDNTNERRKLLCAPPAEPPAPALLHRPHHTVQCGDQRQEHQRDPVGRGARPAGDLPRGRRHGPHRR